MTTVEITDFTVDPAHAAEAVRDLQHVLKGSSHHFILATSESDPASINLFSDSAASLTQAIPNASSQTSRAVLQRSPFQPDETASANVVEMVRNYFPSSRVTPQFQEQVKEAFVRFEEAFVAQATGNTGCSRGWVEGELEHERVPGEKVRCYVIIRGWGSMDDFKRSTETAAFKKAIALLLELKAAAYTMTFHKIATVGM